MIFCGFVDFSVSLVGFVRGFLISSDLGWWVDGGLGCLQLVLVEMR